ncbi:MAG: bifunctional riboflavin kinase/FAD synthetase [Alphaproteobacteria bacterium]|jgi:riboflavin kinase/FMN adenylyltransferase|nr:bifunctional riboflavin kinase/FAD synthetase [Alphaproteobacteria bacterium]
MRITRDIDFVPAEDKGASVAIGNFDGVHLGHQAVIDLARRDDAPLGVLTFEPHPREVFQPDAPPFRLMNAETRAHRLQKIGVDRLYELPFTTAISQLSDHEFAEHILRDSLGVKHVVVGRDFRFGKGRTGTSDALADYGRRMGFEVTIAPMLRVASGEASSTAIREALTEGKPRTAAEMLGHWHRIDGPVIQGDQRGRDLGYPTANMSIDGLHPPKFGVYAVLVEVLNGPHKGHYHGAASIGVRPTFGVNSANCETYLFDFAGDLYGAHLSVALIDYLRSEEQFDGLDALIAQMDADCAKARGVLADV